MQIGRAGRGGPALRPRPGSAASGSTAGWRPPAVDGGPGGSAASGGPVASGAIAGLDALLALQQVDDPTERRRRAARRGSGLLDRLAELHLGLLAGALSERTLVELRLGLAGLERVPDEPGLEAVLTEIAVRVEVELAKLEAGRTRAPARSAAG